MRKRLSKLLKLTMAVASMVSMMIAPVSAETDFEGNKDYYYSMCAGTDLNAEQMTVCKEFMNYIAKDQNSLQQKLDEINEQIAAAKKEISKYIGQISVLQKEVDELNVQIEELTVQEKAINELIDSLKD